MAEAIAVSLITASAGAAAATGATLAITTALVGAGLSFGASMLAQQFLGGSAGDTPSSRQFVNRAAVAVRRRHYGRVKISGDQVFTIARNGILMRVLAHNAGRIDSIEAHYLDDVEVSVDGSGWVLDDQYAKLGGGSYVQIATRLGTDSQSYYGAIELYYPPWDSDHRGNAIAHSLTRFSQPPAENFSEVYPAGERTSYAYRCKASLVWDPRDDAQDPDDPDTWEWSQNAALCILDFLRHETGMRMPLSLFEAEIDSWKRAANVCGGTVTTKSGASVSRYAISGGYRFDERPADVLARMLSACNGRLWPGENGGLQITVGEWLEPSVTITGDMIESYRIAAGNEGPEAYNTLTAVYTDPDLGYIETSAAKWRNAALVADFGEIKTAARLYMVPNHNQCRRLMKQASAKLAPTWRGEVRTNLGALSALYDRYVDIDFSDIGVSVQAEIDDIKFDVGAGGVVRGLIIEFTSIDATAFDFDAATEEGSPSAPPPNTSPDALPVPQDFNVTIASRTAGGTTFAVGVADWNTLSVPLRVEVQYRTSSSSVWLVAGASASGETELETPQLQDGVTYLFRARSVGSQKVSAWSATVTRTVTVDSVAPGVPTALSLELNGDEITVSWTNPNSANCYGARVYRNTTNEPSTATLIDTLYAGPGVTRGKIDSALAAGTYWYWVAAINGSGVASARTAAGTETVV